MASTVMGTTWIARECMRFYKNMDALGRVPEHLTVVFGESGSEVTVRLPKAAYVDPLVLYIFDCQWSPEMDIYEMRERVLKPLVRDALKQRGAWSSAFRKYLKESWRTPPPVQGVA